MPVVHAAAPLTSAGGSTA